MWWRLVLGEWRGRSPDEPHQPHSPADCSHWWLQTGMLCLIGCAACGFQALSVYIERTISTGLDSVSRGAPLKPVIDNQQSQAGSIAWYNYLQLLCILGWVTHQGCQNKHFFKKIMFFSFYKKESFKDFFITECFSNCQIEHSYLQCVTLWFALYYFAMWYLSWDKFLSPYN